MHGQGNYTTQVGQGSFAPPFTFQQRPLPPPPPHQGSLHPQPQVIQQGHSSFHLRPGILAYQHNIPSVPHQRLPAPAVSTVPNSGQSYATPPQPLQGQTNTQMSFSYHTSVQQCSPWNQNVHQFLPAAPPPGPSTYPLVSLQEHAPERGHSHQSSRHIPPPLLQPPNAFSSSSLLRPDPQGVSVVPERQRSYQQPMGSLPPQPLPPPPPPPLPSSSPPGAPPLPPPSPPPPPPPPPSNVLSQNDVSGSLKGEVKNGNNLTVECSRKSQQTEYADPKLEIEDTSVNHLPGDSDMDTEDDITALDTVEKGSSSNNLNNEVEHISTSQDDHIKEEIQDLHNTGIHKLPKVDLDASAVSSASQNLRGVDEPSRQSNGQTQQPLDVPASQLRNSSELSVLVPFSETGHGKLSDQVNECTNPFNLLQDYASDGTSENEDEKLPGGASSPSIIDRKKYFDAKKGCHFGSELGLGTVSDCSKHMVSKSMIESENMTETDKMSLEAGKVENFFDKGRVGQESVTLQSKDASRNYSTTIEGAKLPQQERRNNDLNVDEFGRLIREGVSDSDASDSPGYRRKSARRSRNRSRSPNRSQSPHERRRRSPRRKQRRGRSRSWSPRKSRSPIMRRDAEFTGDKLRRGKGQLSVCFNFARGKCYRGANCRYSHHESDKSERKRYNRVKVKQQYWDKPPVLRSPEFHDDSNSLPEKEEKHKGLRPSVKEVKESKGVPVNSAVCTRKDDEDSSLLVADDIASNVSTYSAHEITSRSEGSSIPESAAAGKIHQINQQCHLIHSSSVPGSSVTETSINTSMHIPADKPDVQQYPTSQMHHPETKPFLMIIPSQPLKELPPSSTIHQSHSQFTLPSSSASRVVSVPLTQPLMQDYNLMPSIAQFHGTLENCSPNRAPVSSQHSQFTVPSNYSSSSFVLPPLPPLPHSHFSSSITPREWGFSSQHTQPSLPPQDNLSAYTFRASQNAECHDRSWTGELLAYSIAREPDRGPTFTDRFESRVNSQLSGHHMRGEDHISRHPVQGISPSQPFAQDQPNTLSVRSTSKGMQHSVGNPFSDNNSPCTQPYVQLDSNEQKYSVTAPPPAQLIENGKVTSSISNCSDFLERSHPSSVREVGSQILNHFNPYGSTVDLPLSSKLSANALTWENDLNINSRYGSTFALTSGPLGDRCKIGSFGSKNGMSLSSELQSKSATPRPGGAQYDPLFDSIEPALNSLVGDDDHQKQETVGDSDDFLKLSGSERILDMRGIKQQGGAAVSANDSVENEEYGETGDAEVDTVLTGSPSNPNDVTDMNAGEVEIDQVKGSGKKRKSKERSMKLFKISIASFVKEVLKPSWRQGNMSKEAFKTIVKKTVDKVSGAMKSHRIPRSQSRINQYIDSSRGKLTKLVMGYVDKYVKV